MQVNSNKIHSIGSDALAEEELLSGKTARLVILVFALNMVSAALFIYLINRPVYDEPYNIFDVHTYATQGLSLETLLSHRNPPGPTGFLWMAAGVRLLRGEECQAQQIPGILVWSFAGHDGFSARDGSHGDFTHRSSLTPLCCIRSSLLD
jgi:hypothetical protein